MNKSSEILLRVLRIEEHILDLGTQLRRMEKRIMAVADDLKAGIAALNAETDVIAALLTSLAGRIKNSMTDAEVADVKAALQAESDRLTTLGVDPLNPVPSPPPPLQASRAKVKP